MNSSNKFSITLIVCGVVGVVLGKWAMSEFFPSQEEKKDKALMAAANNINKNLPINVDSETILFSTTGGQNKFSYNYELLNTVKSGIDVEAFENAMRPYLTNAVCTTGDMAGFRDLGITVTYRYFDSDRIQFSQIDVDTTSC